MGFDSILTTITAIGSDIKALFNQLANKADSNHNHSEFGDLSVDSLSAKNIKVTATVSTGSCNLLLGNCFSLNITGNTTISILGAENNKLCCVLLIITNGGSYAITWPNNTKWDSGSAPVLTATGRDDIILQTIDGGSTFCGIYQAKDVK